MILKYVFLLGLPPIWTEVRQGSFQKMNAWGYWTGPKKKAWFCNRATPFNPFVYAYVADVAVEYLHPQKNTINRQSL
jgi:hypothetical protein